MADSAIEWTDKVWNVVRGCSRVSAGCGGPGNAGGCYAERQAYRFSGPGQPYEGLVRMTPSGPRWTGKVALIPEKLEEPLRWRKPQKIFVNSMSDLFHEGVSDVEIDRVFVTMWYARQHTFQVLTKRPRRMLAWSRGMLNSDRWDAARLPLYQAFREQSRAAKGAHRIGLALNRAERVGVMGAWPEWPLPNVWLGVSVEDQATADERIPFLLETPAAKHFVSYEPALGPVDFKKWHGICENSNCPHTIYDCRNGPDVSLLDLVIVGGESGPGARPCDVAWIRSAVRQCREAQVACFVKQLGARPILDVREEDVFSELCAAKHRRWHDPGGAEPRRQVLALKDRKGGDPSEWPEDLRVREFPA